MSKDNLTDKQETVRIIDIKSLMSWNHLVREPIPVVLKTQTDMFINILKECNCKQHAPAILNTKYDNDHIDWDSMQSKDDAKLTSKLSGSRNSDKGGDKLYKSIDKFAWRDETKRDLKSESIEAYKDLAF